MKRISENKSGIIFYMMAWRAGKNKEERVVNTPTLRLKMDFG